MSAAIKPPETARYRVEQQIGKGGMGVVFEAYDVSRGQRVALKTLNNLDPQSLYQFKQEFRALSDVTHPNLVALYELHADEGQWFFTMELIRGRSFLDYIRDSLPDGDAQRRSSTPTANDWSTVAEKRDGMPISEETVTHPPATLPSVTTTPIGNVLADRMRRSCASHRHGAPPARASSGQPGAHRAPRERSLAP